MVTFLLTIAVLGILIFAGCRLNMYLYTRGVVGANSRTIRQMQSVESFSMYEGDFQGRDYGLRYARTGILMIAAVITVLSISLIVLLLAMLH